MDTLVGATHGSTVTIDGVVTAYHGTADEFTANSLIKNNVDPTRSEKVNLGHGLYVSTKKDYCDAFPVILEIKFKPGTVQVWAKADTMLWMQNANDKQLTKYAKPGVLDRACPGQFCIQKFESAKIIKPSREEEDT